MKEPWRPFFPLKVPRPEQERALDRAVELVDSGEKFIVAELGTGVGKSAFAVCLANYINARTKKVDDPFQRGAYVLTSQKTLQDQYVADFPGNVNDLRSSGNFTCLEGPGQTCGQTMRYKKLTKTGDVAPGGGPGKLSCDDCPYRIAKDGFMKANVGVTNYSYFLSETVYSGELLPRDLLVLDETHNVESEMRSWATFLVEEERSMGLGEELPFGAGKAASLDWLLRRYKPTVVEAMDALSAKVEAAERKKGVKKGIEKMVDELDFLDKHVCGLNRLFEFSPAKQNVEGDNYLVDWEEDRDGRRVLRVQPLDSGPLANDLLYPYGSHVLMMSATVLDQKTFMRSTGLKKAAMIREPSPFPPENFGITYRPVGRMSKAHIQTTMPKMVGQVRDILAKNPKEKGIIHCANYEIARALTGLNDRRLLIQTTARDRGPILEKHRASKEPTMIVSPSMMEGLDLEGDLGRLQIICKVPFPNMGDPVVSAKMKLDRGWYAWCTARSVVQAVGRCVRNKDDWTRTYILDESFGPFFSEWAEMFPPHFLSMEIEG